jgi:hypothetical protein
MKEQLRAGLILVTAAAFGIALAGCGSDSGSSEASSSSASSSAETSSSEEDTTTEEATPSESPAPTGTNKTIAEYIKEAGITEAPVKRGDPGSPTVNLPTPPGWEDAGAQTPDWAWGAILYNQPPVSPDGPPSVIAIMSKLTGNVDPAKILEYAPGEVKNLPGYENQGDGNESTLGGFDAYQIGGAYVKDGVKRVIAQKTVVIPGADGLFVLQLNADGTEDQLPTLMDVTGAIDEETTITP